MGLDSPGVGAATLHPAYLRKIHRTGPILNSAKGARRQVQGGALATPWISLFSF